MKRGFCLIAMLLFLFSILFVVFPVLGVNACCERDTEGNWCQYTDESACDEAYLSTYTSCEQTSFCQVGCCYSSDEGSCYKNTPRATCEAETDFSWSDSSGCAIDQCTQGCCVIADQAFYVTEVKCKSVGSAYEDASVSFDSTITTEAACLNSVKNLDFGCCVEGSSAVFQTREECSASSTEVGVNFTVEGFHEGMLCSNDLLSTECAKQQYTGCYQGKVYWYDSCGNRENIYSSDDRVSYNNGYVLDEEDSCTASGPYDRTCGNCDYSLGMTCGTDEENVMSDGDYTCIDLNCEEAFENSASPQFGSEKKNGESWCIYDQEVGQGLDTVGSRHYRHLCINGEEITESCMDYREEICVGGILGEDSLENLEALSLGQGEYVEAACRENRADFCSSCNDETLGLTDRYECCAEEDTKDCYWLPTGSGVEEGATYEDGRCIPQVPLGLKFWSDSGTGDDASSSSTCSVASATCTVIYRIQGVTRLIGGGDNPNKWRVITESPDGCASKDWLVDQNTYCRSLGDCGAYYNFVGEPSYDGFSSTMFDETFFNEVKDIEGFDTNDLGDWDSLKSVDEKDESHFFSVNSPHVFENPAFYVATISALAGGFSNIADKTDGSCMFAAEAKREAAEAAAAATGLLREGERCSPEPKGKEKNCAEGLSCINSEGKTTCQKKEADITKSCADLGYTAGNTGDSYYYKCVSGGYTSCKDDKEDTEVKTIATAGSWPLTKPCAGVTAMDPSKAASAPEVPQYGGKNPVVDALSTTSSAASTIDKVKGLSATDKLGCFVGGALPIPTSWIGGAAKGVVTSIMNYITLIAAAYLVVDYANANETTITYTAECNLWQPPSGGENCELCNDENTPCSEYRCKSLGASCALINAGSANETCISQYVNDVNSPVIEPLPEDLEQEGYTIRETSEEGNKGYEIEGLVPAFTPLTLGIATDEPAQCKYTPEIGTEFEDMQNFFGSDIYLYEHTLTFSLGDEVTEEEIVALTQGIYTVYVRCADANGNANERDYFIRFTIDTTPDLTPPEILYTSIQNGAYMQYNASETGFSLYTNEPAQCKWNSNDTDYTLMGGDMECASSGYEQSSQYYGTYECSTTLTEVAEDELNSFYFRCKDNSENVNEESFTFTTKQTESPLVVSSVAPSGTVYDFALMLEAETEDGADYGKAVCGFALEDVGYYSMAQFLTTNSTDHSQPLTLPEGEYTYYIICQDIAGNQAGNRTTFTVEIDTSAPVIEELYVDTIYSVLFLGMDEDSACEYAPDDFVYGEGSVMTGVNTTSEHEANLEAAAYSVRCRDLYNNEGEYFIDLSTWV